MRTPGPGHPSSLFCLLPGIAVSTVTLNQHWSLHWSLIQPLTLLTAHSGLLWGPSCSLLSVSGFTFPHTSRIKPIIFTFAKKNDWSWFKQPGHSACSFMRTVQPQGWKSWTDISLPQLPCLAQHKPTSNRRERETSSFACSVPHAISLRSSG